MAFDELTNREREILDLLARGLTDAEIAHRLGLSPRTVSNNVSKVMLKVEEMHLRCACPAHVQGARVQEDAYARLELP